LFDDIFSELDVLRIEKVINLLADSSAQIFITLTEPNLVRFNDLDKNNNLNSEIKKTFFEIEAGKIKQ
jgi:recombinational DNA repair ATPase RecF